MNCLDDYGMDYTRLHTILEAMRAGLEDKEFAFLSVLVVDFLVNIDDQIELINRRLKQKDLPDYMAELYLCESDEEYFDKLTTELDVWERLKRQKVLILSNIKGIGRKRRKKSR